MLSSHVPFRIAARRSTPERRARLVAAAVIRSVRISQDNTAWRLASSPFLIPQIIMQRLASIGPAQTPQFKIVACVQAVALLQSFLTRLVGYADGISALVLLLGVADSSSISHLEHRARE